MVDDFGNSFVTPRELASKADEIYEAQEEGFKDVRHDIAELRTEVRTSVTELRTEVRWIKRLGPAAIGLAVAFGPQIADAITR